nr:hypothetical protein BaRGS_027020 [Batillaria attramentaria]
MTSYTTNTMSRLPVLLIVMAVIVCCWGDYSPFRNKINNLGPAAKNILDNMAALSKVKRGGSDELDDEGGSCTCPPAIDALRRLELSISEETDM